MTRCVVVVVLLTSINLKPLYLCVDLVLTHGRTTLVGGG